MGLKVYADRMSQPSRAVILFCKINGIDFEEIRVDLMKRQQYILLLSLFIVLNCASFEWHILAHTCIFWDINQPLAINPMSKVPTIVDGRFKLFESHAILIYICCAFPGVASHWYPGDVSKRAKIQSVLDWHHSNLRPGSAGFVFNTILGPQRGILSSPETVKESEKILMRSLSKLENFWLKDGRFLVGSSQPSIADISLVSEIMQLELLSEKDHDWILSPYKKVLQWVEDTKSATASHFDEVHRLLFRAQKRFREQMATQSGKSELKSRF